MTAEETAAFQDKYGYKISGFRVAVDALAVYVNKANPVACLTLPQLSGICSSNRKTPGTSDVRTWGDLGLTSEWARQPITLYTRNTLSGTYEYFRETALYGGDYKPEIKQQSGSEAVVQAVAADKFGIGYSGIGYKNEGVRAVRSRRSMAVPATRLRPRRHSQANTRSRGICMSTSTESRASRSMLCVPSS
jgi:phosphate transport system substrate-binding protein